MTEINGGKDDDRLYLDTNFSENQLSTSKKSIWTGYFADSLSEIPSYQHSDKIGTDASPELVPTVIPSSRQASQSSKLKSVYTLRGKLAEQSKEPYQRKFFATATFHGHVTARSGSGFVADLEGSGDQYEFSFSKDELPTAQREELRVGSSIVVHIGHAYERGTKRYTMKIFLSNYGKHDRFRDKLIEKKLSRWKF